MRPFLLLATRAQDAAARGEYHGVLRYGGLAAHELRHLRLDRQPMPELNLADYSGVIVGGSPFNSSDPHETKSEVQLRVEREVWQLLDEIVDRDYPFLGACYGVGTLGTHEGATIDHTYAEEVGPVRIELTEAGLADPVLAGIPRFFDAYVGHKEAVTQLPDSAVLLATSQPTPVQMFRMRENLYATQFHPELDLPGILERIDIYQGFGYFTPEETPEVIARCSAGSVAHAHKVLANFVARYRAQ